MKKIIIIIGVLLVLLGMSQGGKYLQDYNILTEYGKGLVWGSVILITAGVLLIIFALIKKSRK